MLLELAEVDVVVCANPTRARSLPSFRPLPVSFARLPHLSGTHICRPADRSVRLLQPSLAVEVRTSMLSMARMRAARCGLGGGASSLQSDVVVAGGLRGRTLRVRSADRICASWRLLSEPEQEQHPGPARWATRRRHRVGQCARVRRVLGVRVSCVGTLLYQNLPMYSRTCCTCTCCCCCRMSVRATKISAHVHVSDPRTGPRADVRDSRRADIPVSADRARPPRRRRCRARGRRETPAITIGAHAALPGETFASINKGKCPTLNSRHMYTRSYSSTGPPCVADSRPALSRPPHHATHSSSARRGTQQPHDPGGVGWARSGVRAVQEVVAAQHSVREALKQPRQHVRGAQSGPVVCRGGGRMRARSTRNMGPMW